MAGEDKDFLKRLLATFRVEAAEHLKTMASLLLQLEATAPSAETAAQMETLFREAHSLKGAARAVDLHAIETICQALESTLALFRQKEMAPPPAAFDTLHRALDQIGQLLAADTEEPQAAMAAADIARALGALAAAAPAAQAAVPAPPPPRAMPGVRESEGAGTVRISTARLDALMVQAEELLAFKFGAEHFLADMRALQSDVAAWRKASGRHAGEARGLRRSAGWAGAASANLNLNGRKSRVMSALLQAIEDQERFARQLAERVTRLERSAAQERRALGGMVDNLLEEMKQALMLPFSSLLELFPKLVRDLAQDCGKKVDLVIDGAALEIDRRVLEQIREPLIHLLRNAVDHGIEAPDERIRNGKPERGRIRIEIASRDGNKVELQVADDGRGIDPARVIAKAVAQGVLDADAARQLDEWKARALIFESGLSTSAMVTEMSGRGLGLAIVREKVERLGGSIDVEPAAPGVCFRMVLPTSLTTYRGLLIRVGTRRFVLPSRNVERVTRTPAVPVRAHDTVELDGDTLPLLRLGDVLGVAHDEPSHDGTESGMRHLALVVLGIAERRIAFAVDQVLGDQDVLVKSLGPLLQRVRNIAGATVLGAGTVVPILNVPDLLNSALRPLSRNAVAHSQKRQPAPRKAILLAEDSITSRSLLKNILESAGYTVSTAVDGLEALTALRSGVFDLLVSDVEMPRMDGFALTGAVRADPRLSELPVVLVTSLESRQHRERGVEAGANAYIVKSSFDQDNLLEVVRRLI